MRRKTGRSAGCVKPGGARAKNAPAVSGVLPPLVSTASGDRRPRSRRGKPRILLLEDDQKLQLLYALALSKTAQLSLYTRVEAALEVLDEADLLILDHGHGRKADHLALLRFLQAHRLPLPFLVTAERGKGVELRDEVPRSSLLGKPFTLGELDAALTDLGFPGLVRRRPPDP